MNDPYRRVDLVTMGWHLEAVAVLRTHRERRIGMRNGNLEAALLSARSVHTFGMTSPIWIIDLGRSGTVHRVRHLPPRRAVLSGPLVLEIREGCEIPSIGDVLVALPSSGHGRNPRDVCDADRQP